MREPGARANRHDNKLGQCNQTSECRARVPAARVACAPGHGSRCAGAAAPPAVPCCTATTRVTGLKIDSGCQDLCCHQKCFRKVTSNIDDRDSGVVLDFRTRDLLLQGLVCVHVMRSIDASPELRLSSNNCRAMGTRKHGQARQHWRCWFPHFLNPPPHLAIPVHHIS